MKVYRTNGAIGALLDEYEKAMIELKAVIEPITTEQLVAIMDKETKDPDCRSIQTILAHVVDSGYYYAIAIRQGEGEKVDYVKKELLVTIKEYQLSLDKMFDYNCRVFEDYPQIVLEQYNPEDKILTRWNQIYDVEQMMEHAIVHILRHRRQIERFLLL